MRCLTRSGIPTPPPHPQPLRSANGSRGHVLECSLPSRWTVPPSGFTSHTQFSFTIPFPVFCSFSSISSLFIRDTFIFFLPIVGKEGRQNAFRGGAWETAPVLRAFTWILHLLSLNCLSLPLLNLPPLCSFGGVRAIPVAQIIKESACNAGDQFSIPGLGRSSGKGNGNPLQDSCLADSMHRDSMAGYSPWGQTRLSD